MVAIVSSSVHRVQECYTDMTYTTNQTTFLSLSLKRECLETKSIEKIA